MTATELDEILAGADFDLGTSEAAMRWAPKPPDGYAVTYTLNGLPHVDLTTSPHTAQWLAGHARLLGAVDVTVTPPDREDVTDDPR